MKTHFWFKYIASVLVILVVFGGVTAWWVLIRPQTVKAGCQKTTQASADKATKDSTNNINNTIKSIAISSPQLMAEYDARIAANDAKSTAADAEFKSSVNNWCYSHFTMEPFISDCISANAWSNVTREWTYNGSPWKQFVDDQGKINDAKNAAEKALREKIDSEQSEAYGVCLTVNGVK